jgi:hypothetical protein
MTSRLLKRILIALLLAMPTLATAAEFPDYLYFHNRPIDPLCFNEDSVNLAHCGVYSTQGRTVIGANEKLTDAGFIGYEYTENDWHDSRAYTYYKPIGKAAHGYIVYTMNNTGGSGIFSSLIYVIRKGNFLITKTIQGGDRCNGGVSEPVLENSQLTYHEHITPLDYFGFQHVNPHTIPGVRELHDCAACCAGFAVYSRPVQNTFSGAHFEYVDFTQYARDLTLERYDKSLENCFDTLIKQYAQHGQTRLDPQQLELFTADFHKQCLKE